MKVKGIMTQMSGSVGGWTGSHNRGGLYFRARAIPVNPQSAAQQVARTRFAIAVAGWTDLDDAGRAAWDTYAGEQSWTNVMGDSIQLSGQQAFVAANSALQAAGLSQITLPPVPNTRPEAVPVAVSSIDNGGAMGAWEVSATPATGPADAADRILIAVGRPVSPGKKFYDAPYRIGASIAGNGAIPAGIQTALTAVLGASANAYIGTKIPLQFRVVLAVGTYSAFTRLITPVVEDV